MVRPNTAVAPSTHPHFTLPSFLSHLPFTASHSLPPSPNRLPHHGHAPGNFSAHAIRFYSMGVPPSASTEALALESRRGREHNDVDLPDSKKQKLNDKSSGSDLSKTTHSLQKPIIVGGGNAHHPLIGPTATPQGVPCFPLATTRFPFVGMPLLTQPQILTAANTSTSSSFVSGIQTQTIKEEETQQDVDDKQEEITGDE